MYELT